MKALTLLIAASLAIGTTAHPQPTTVHGSASAESRTAVSADRRGADVTTDNGAQGAVVARRGDDGSGQQTAAATEMDATLERSVDARRAKPGDEVTATTNDSFTTASGVTVPRGSRLVGRVTEARPHARGQGSADGAASSQLGIVFDRAELPDGRAVPMQATIQAIAAARSHAERGGASSHAPQVFGSTQASGGGLARTGIGSLGTAGTRVAGNAGAAVGGATRLPQPAVGAATHGAGAMRARGGALAGASSGAVGGLSASGQWLAGSRGVFGVRDTSIASAAAGSALITSTSRNVRLDGGTQLLVVGDVGATSR